MTSTRPKMRNDELGGCRVVRLVDVSPSFDGGQTRTYLTVAPDGSYHVLTETVEGDADATGGPG